MYNITHYLVLFICVLSGLNAQYDEGDICELDSAKGVLGTCQIINKCEYAQKQLYQDQIHPPMCSWKGSTRVVCCPEGLLHETGVLSRYFLGSDDGVMRNHDTICRYNGYLPMVCCSKNLDIPQTPEPRECGPLPPIESPTFSDMAHEIAWTKCVENQRYVDICEQDPKDLDVYTRTTVCNITDTTLRITGDLTAGISEFPHMAALGCSNAIETEDVDIVWVGGGSLISDKFILTAGHILTENTHGRLRYALLGALNKTDLESGLLYNVIRLIPHKYYTTADKHDDIALVELDRRVKFSEFIRPICLPVPGLIHDDTRIVSGWGDVGQYAGTSKVLKKAYISEVPLSVCKAEVSISDSVWRDDTMTCAKGLKTRSGLRADTCPGDSGGPLMSKVKYPGISCNYVLNGVVSWGPTCGGGAGVYTKVQPYLSWIVNNTWPEEVRKRTPAEDYSMSFPSLLVH